MHALLLISYNHRVFFLSFITRNDIVTPFPQTLGLAGSDQVKATLSVSSGIGPGIWVHGKFLPTCVRAIRQILKLGPGVRVKWYDPYV